MAKKRRFMDGGNADPEGTADAGRADGTAGVEGQGGFGGPDYGGTDYSGLDAAMAAPGMAAPKASDFDLSQIDPKGLAELQAQRGKDIAAQLGGLGLVGKLGAATGINNKLGSFLAEREFSGSSGTSGIDADHNQHRPDYGTTDPMQSGIAQTTQAGAGAAGSGERRYVWDPVLRQYVLANLGAGGNPMNYTQGQTFNMGQAPTPYLGRPVNPAYAMAAGGAVDGGITEGLQARHVRGPGDGQSDSIPVQMDDGGQGRLADGEFVVDATTVAALGNGSSDAGARMLYEMVKRIRETAHGRNDLQKPVDPNKVMPV